MRKSEQGYLLFAAILLVMLMGAIGASMTYLFTGSTNSIIKTTMSEQAFYLAESGVNTAIRYWSAKSIPCASLNGNVDLTAAALGAGEFTVTATKITNSTTLSSGITAAATTIPLVSTAGFPTDGAVTIGSEGIYYTGISGNNLTGAVRGAGATTAAAQSSAAAVTQNECIISSTAGVPNLTNPAATRSIEATLFTFPSGASSTIGTVASIGAVSLVSGSIANDHSCLTCANYAGANITTNSASNTFTSFSTQVDATAADGGQLTTSSYSGSIKADIKQNATFTTTTLYDTYFKQTRAYLQANAGYVGTSVKNRNGILIYADGNVNANNGTIGTAANPTVLYVAGSLTLSSTSVYGIIYATGPVNLSNMSGNGTIASESTISLNSIGLAYDHTLLKNMTTNPTFSNILNIGSITGSSGSGTNNAVAANTQETFN